MSFRQLKQNTHKLLTGFMAIWLSGAVFLFCCEKTNGAPEGVEFCPMAKISAHCDKAKQGASVNVSISTEEPSVDCCGFLPAIFDKARKLERTQKQTASAPVTLVVSHLQVPIAENKAVSDAFLPFIADHQKLFIHNCVFRV